MRYPTHCGCGAPMRGPRCSLPLSEHARRTIAQIEAEDREAGYVPVRTGDGGAVVRVSGCPDAVDWPGCAYDPMQGRR